MAEFETPEAGLSGQPEPTAEETQPTSEEAATGAPASLEAELARVREALQAAEAKLRTVESEQQRLLEMVRELGTPVLPIHDGILVLPLIGHLESARGVHLMDDLLQAIQYHQAEVVLIDITGVSVVDTSVANSLIQATRAAALLGTGCILVGVSAAVSRTLVQLGVDLAKVTTRRDLQAGIAHALKRRGYAIVRSRPEIDWLTEFDEKGEKVEPGEKPQQSQ